MEGTCCIGKVVIFNRDEGQYRLAGAIVRIGIDSNKTNNAICGTVTDSMVAQSLKVEVVCSRKGRYISIHSNTAILTLCEVQAYGRCGNGKAPNNANY